MSLKSNTMLNDVVVIGGGPAGMMAAGRAGELGAKVALLEKNSSLGRKLLITGKGRSNITRAEFNPKELLKKYGREGDFLLHALSTFGPKETVDFFEKRGLKMKVERGKRIFPETDSSKDVLDILMCYLKDNNVEIKTNSEVKEIISSHGKISKIILSSGKEISAKNYIIATGGKVFPGTGSTGAGYDWAEKLGHTVAKLRPALVPVKIKEDWPQKLQGLSLKNVELTVFQNGKKKDSRFGELLFTHFGLSGPIVLDLSFIVGELLERGEVKLVLDLKPAMDQQSLDKRIQSDFIKYNNKFFKNSLDDLLPQKFIPIIIELSGIDPFKKVNVITKKERRGLAKIFKNLKMTVSSLLGFESAIVTSGGVLLREIDSKTMRSKLIENLFFAGEIINLHGPTGGYNLQICWSSGYLAGQSASKRK
ncbi:MAG: NAD(P)/FAD-dependent oxidoreductase [Candidatus Nealsonbacteria bacterium]|nr:NAD(P)/FAD-dependent oxidoreductase [Candidatus Nealsonbacteria bacterium]